jgi:ceramide glucosyltransferase
MKVVFFSFLGVALFGTLTSSVFLGMVVVAAVRFHRIARAFLAHPEPANLPPVSLLKPVHGAEPGLEEYLEGFFQLDYPDYEILFCARTEADAGLRLARGVSARHPDVPVRFLVSGDPPWPNARCYSVSIMAAAAKHDLMVVTDSDVRVRRPFLREVMECFADSQVGAATCVYCGSAKGLGLWGLMEGMGMSVEMTAGVLVADMLEGMRFTLGPCMAVRREALAAIGGFEKLGDYYADDFVLGNLVAQAGWKVALSTHVIDHCIVHDGFWRNFVHQWNWMRSTRFSRPMGHLGTGLTFAAPFGIIGALAGWAAGMPVLGVSLLAWSYLSRVLLCLVVGGWIVQDPDAYRFCYLYPLRDLMGAILWLLSYTSRKVGWRNDRFVLAKGGLMRKVGEVHDPGIDR